MNNENTLKAIKDAKSQGFVDEYITSGSSGSMPHSDIFLSPAFWQALGRARGWSEDEYSVSFGSTHPTLATRFGGRAYTLNTWRYHWHHFIDALAEGKNAESFFKDLLPASTHLSSGDA